MLGSRAMLLAVGLVSMPFCGGAAFAETAGADRLSEQVRVSYADLDLNSDAGASILLRRIRNAAERACGQDAGVRELRRRSDIRVCVRGAVDHAVAGVNSTQVHAVYAEARAGRRQLASSERVTVQSTGAQARVVVPYAGYNLNSEPGRLAVSRGLESAARRACGAGWRVSRAERACMDEIVRDGQVQIAAVAERQYANETAPAPASADAADAAALVRTSVISSVATAPEDSGVCAPRALTSAFGAASASLGRSERNAIAHAVDSASVCRLSAVTIAVGGSDALAQRRGQALRAALMQRGVPAALIQVRMDGASQAEVRMAFNGVATADSVAAAASSAPVS